jgi:hypothetical protein
MLHDVLTNLCWRTPAGDASDGFSREMSMVIGTAVRRWLLAAVFLLLTAWVDPVAAQEAPPEPAGGGAGRGGGSRGAEEQEEAEVAEVAAEEDVRDEPVWRDRWDLTAELSYTDQSGNSELRLFTGGFRARHLDRDRFRLDLSVESRYGRSGGDVVARRNEGSLAFDLHPRNRWTPFVFTSAQQDPIRRLDLRLSSGFGAKYTLERARRDPDVSLSLALLRCWSSRATPSSPGSSGCTTTPSTPPRAGSVQLAVQRAAALPRPPASPPSARPGATSPYSEINMKRAVDAGDSRARACTSPGRTSPGRTAGT